jgi:hypothetical protein
LRSERERRHHHCALKQRHSTRRDAQVVLNATLGGGVEHMAPYPCKFCAGWHNGRMPILALAEAEAVCVARPCRHRAMTHDPRHRS